MPFVTTLTLQSGDRKALDRVVSEIKAHAERKGAEFRGPHAAPPKKMRVPQSKRVDSPDQFDAWQYTVYERRMEIVGHDDVARNVARRTLPRSIHVEFDVEQVSTPGSG